jgi:hypothetical protein
MLGNESQQNMIKLTAWVVLLVAINSAPLSAAPEQCLSIKRGVDRQACYDRQASDRAESQKSGLSDNPKMDDPIAKLKLEDDRLAKRLQGICRGC